MSGSIGSNPEGVPGGVIPDLHLQPLVDPTLQQEIPYLADWMTLSSLAPSDQQRIESALYAGMPRLETIEFSIAETQHEIIIGFLEDVAESYKELERRLEEWMDSSAFQAWLQQHSPTEIRRLEDDIAVARGSSDYQVWLQTQPADVRARETGLDRAYELIQNVNNGLNAYLDGVSKGDSDMAVQAAFMAGTMILGMQFISNFMHTGDIANIAPANEINQIWSKIAPEMIPGNMAAELGLIGAMFAVGPMNMATIEVLKGAEEGKPKGNNLDKATENGKQIIKLVNSEEFENFVNGALANSKLTGAEQGQIMAALKLTLLAHSLGMVYLAEAGRMSPEEFRDMFLQGLGIEEGDIKSELMQQINALMYDDKVIPEGLRTKIFDSLLEYFEEEHDPEEAFNLDNLLHSFAEGEAFHQTNIGKSVI